MSHSDPEDGANGHVYEKESTPQHCRSESPNGGLAKEDYCLRDLIDIDWLERLVKRFSDVSGLSGYVFDPISAMPIISSQRPICDLFFRNVEASHAICKDHAIKLTNSLKSERDIRASICPHGLVEVATPVMVEGKLIASFVVGQTFLDPPDIAWFSRAVDRYGFDKDRYMEALEKVPVMTKEHLRSELPLLEQLGSLVARLASLNARLKMPASKPRERIKDLEAENEALRRRVNALETMMNATSDRALFIDMQGKVLAHNEAATRFVEEGSAELEGRTIFDFLPRGEAAAQRRWLEEVIRTGRSIRWVDEKETVSCENRLFPVMDSNGRVKGAALYSREETDRSLVIQILKESERRLATLMANLPGIAYRGRNIKGRSMEFISEGCLRLTGYAPSQLVEGGELTYGDLIYPDDRESVWRTVQEAVAKKKPFEMEYRIRTSSGEQKWVWEKGRAVSAGIPGSVKLEGFVTDITERKRAEKLSDGQLAFMELLLQAIPGPVYYKNTDLVYVGCNEAFAEYIGLAKERIIGRTAYEIVPAEMADRYQEMDEALLNNPGSQVYESAVPSADGSKRHVIFHKAAFRDSLGKVAGLIGVIIDITQRKNAEKALAEREQLLEQILSASPVGIGHVEDRSLDWANQALLDMFGFNEEADYRRKTTRILYASDEEFGRVGRLAYSNFSSGQITETDARFRRKDGTCFDGHLKISAPDPSYPMRGTILTISDMSQSKLAEERLRQSEARYRNLFERSTDAIIILHPDGDILDANQAASFLLGIKLEELIGTNIKHHYLRPQDLEAFKRELEQRGVVTDFEWLAKRSDGTERICLVNSSVRTNEKGDPTAFLSLVRDVTERKRLETQLRQAQKMESIATLAGGIAHDFNNLLTIAAGYTELLLAERTKDSEGYEELQAIRHASVRGADLVKRILTFTRKVETNPAHMNLNDEIRHVQKLLYKTIPKMIDIELKLADELGSIFADPSQIEQVILNLAINAQHAMPDGGRLVFSTVNADVDEEFCKSHVEAYPGDFVQLTVSDTGHGMDRATLDRIFEPFFTTKKSGEGTGLGLAMVYGIVKGHEGFLTCESSPGAGTTFKLYFPAYQRAPEADVAVSQEMPALSSQTILLVDDEEHIRALAERILTKRGHTVIKARGAKEALEIYAKQGNEIDLVLLDLIMPEMGGKQCLEELLKIDPMARVVIASGFAIDSETRAYLESNARGFVAKPFKVRDLLRVVRLALGDQ